MNQDEEQTEGSDTNIEAVREEEIIIEEEAKTNQREDKAEEDLQLALGVSNVKDDKLKDKLFYKKPTEKNIIPESDHNVQKGKNVGMMS